MIFTPYETTLLSGTNFSKLKSNLERLVIQGGTLSMRLSENDDFEIRAIVEPNESIQAFYQPMVLEIPQRKTTVVYDARPYKNNIAIQNPNTSDEYGKITPGANPALNALHASAVLTGIWKNGANDIVNVSPLPVLAYGSLLTESLSRRIGLDPAASMKLMTTFHVFYMSRAMNPVEMLSHENKTGLALSLSRKFNISPEEYTSVLDTLTPEDLDNFVSITEYISKQNWSPRLNKVSAKDYYGLVMGGWIGQGNPKETMLVALEFPPVWVALCQVISNNNFLSKLPLGQIIKRLNRGNTLNQFNQQVNYLLHQDN